MLKVISKFEGAEINETPTEEWANSNLKLLLRGFC